MTVASLCARRVARFRALMEERGYDAVILRNNPDLRWLTGVERVFDSEQAHTAFLTQDGLWLHTDSRYYNSFVERMGTDGVWQLDGDAVDAVAWAAGRVLKARARVAAVEDTCPLSFFDGLQAELAAHSMSCLLPRLHGDLVRLRIVKDREELGLLARAQEVTDDAFDHIRGYIKAGLTERQIRAELEHYMLMHGADALSFDTIVAAGPNGANPHAKPSDYMVREGDLIVMDYGAAYHDYHADMTRTVCVGEPSEEQRHVYDVVREANEACEAAAKPGCIGRDIHDLAAKVISDAGYGPYFGHGLGHGVGIEIHEGPRLSRLYGDEVPVGSVITIEPGIYLPGRFGIRLEDCGHMAEDGYHPFGRSAHDLLRVG